MNPARTSMPHLFLDYFPFSSDIKLQIFLLLFFSSDFLEANVLGRHYFSLPYPGVLTAEHAVQ